MQISKSFLLVCVAAYCVALLPLRAADADTELKLRQALEKKLDELQTQPSAPALKPAVTAPQAKPMIAPKPVPAPVVEPAAPPVQAAPKPVVTPPPQTAQPKPAVQTTAPALVAPPAMDSESIAKAREALRKKMAELEAQSPTPAAVAPPTAQVFKPIATPAPKPEPIAVTAPPPVAPPATVPPSAPAPAVKTPPTAAQSMPVLEAPTPADAETIAKARTAMEQKMKELDTQAPAETAAAKPAVPATAPRHPALKGLPAFPPLQAPPLGISAEKEQRLQVLLQKYRADQITPEQYHEQRAKILAEP